ncbi:MAG: ATP phosphoribosyltransferase regulatory subunit [Coriobacteriia bacterium]|nr:ATP phosphoribosyltransferase regulatory subunit [Coriobacteriia bacterium]MCL2749906.1 ATP phosphoribosyltransferase regulatory subunit [Coriobacteriia bacterium]
MKQGRNRAVIPVTPRGFKDVLPGEARWRESIISKTRKTLALWGYAPIETPTLEVLEVLEQGGTLTSTPFRLFDTDNELLVLRPDVTLQVARMAASRLKKEDLPLRLRYVERIYREEESQRGLSRQLTQIGVEAIGFSGMYADAEMVLLLVDTLRAAGLTDFTIALGTVGVLRELLELCVESKAVDEAWSAELIKAFHAGNYVAIEQLTNAPGLDARYVEILRVLPTISGKSEAVERVRKMVAPLGIVNGLEQLYDTYTIIEGAGLAPQVNIDFSVVSAFDYYTGLVIEAYAPGLGKALGSGGRYDRMLEGFGISAPAAGFAVSLESIMQALLNEDAAEQQEDTSDTLTVTISDGNPAEAFIKAKYLRSQGKVVTLEPENGTRHERRPLLLPMRRFSNE